MTPESVHEHENCPSRVVFVLPSLDPDERILSLTDELAAAAGNGFELLVVDDGSRTEKQAVFERLAAHPGCTVLKHDRNRGKGAALKTAFRHLLEKYPAGSDFAGCVTADGDGQHLVKDILAAAETLRRHPESLVLGCRVFSGGKVPWKSRLGNNLTKFMFGSVLRIRVSDTQTGLRGIPADFMRTCLDLKGDRFEFETEMLLAARKTGTAIAENPIETVYFDENSGTHFHPVKDACRIYGVIFRYLFAELFRYALVSVSSSLLDAFLFWLFWNVIFTERITIRLPWGECSPVLFLSCFIARVCSSLWNYWGNRRLVFPAGAGGRRAPVLKSMAGYYLLCAGIFTASWLLTAGASHFVPKAYLVFAKAGIDAMLFFVSFFTQKFIIFRSKASC